MVNWNSCFQFISFMDFFWSIQHILLYQISEKASNTNLSRPNLKHASIIFSAEQFRNRPDYIIFNCLIAWIMLECLNVYYNLVSLFHVSWMVYYFLLEFVTHFSWIQKKYILQYIYSNYSMICEAEKKVILMWSDYQNKSCMS